MFTSPSRSMVNILNFEYFEKGGQNNRWFNMKTKVSFFDKLSIRKVFLHFNQFSNPFHFITI